MADNFFKHYPLVRYGNTVAVNILSKIAFQKDNDKSYYTYHPYTVKEGERAEMVAHYYYGDPGYDWVVYYSNMIVDPYFDWPMDTRTFKSFIENKYGSLSEAQSKIKFYRSNYISDFSLISVAAYEALSEKQKAFWSPVIGSSNKIIQYERKKEEVIRSTNKTLSLSINVAGNTSFTVGEDVVQRNGSVVVAIGNLGFSNSSIALINSVRGEFSNSYFLRGSTSGANATVGSVSTVTTAIEPELVNYFEPVSFYDYENELNEKRKNIRLLDVAYVEEVNRQFKELLK